MPKHLVVVYGPGGFDPNLPNANVVEQYEVDVPDLEPTREDLLTAQVADLEAALAALLDALGGTA